MQLQVGFVLRAVVQRLHDREPGVVEVFLHEQAHRQIVVGFVVVVLQPDRLLVVVVRFLEYPDREVSIAQVLEQLGLLLELQALF